MMSDPIVILMHDPPLFPMRFQGCYFGKLHRQFPPLTN
jgi:hypothetical protein